MKILKIYFFALLLPIISIGQINNFQFDHIKVEDGLSQSSVNDIFIDDYGFMWFCTEHGLNRFDGKEFKIFTAEEDNPNSISNFRVFCGLSDNSGYLWIGTEIGLNKIDPVSTKVYKYFNQPNNNKSLSSNEIRSLYLDIDSVLWVGSGKGLNRYIPGKDEFARYPLNNPDSNNVDIRINTIEQDIEDKSILWLGTIGHGIIKFNKTTGEFKFFRFISNNSYYDVNTIGTIKNRGGGIIYIGTYGGFVIFDTKKEKLVEYHSFQIEDYSFSTDRVTDIEFMPNGTIWFATWNDGIIITDMNLNNPINIRHNPENIYSLSNNRTLKLFEHSNIVWIGTYSGGLNKYDFSLIKFPIVRSQPGNPSSLISNEVWGFFEDSRNNFWVCTDKGLELRINNNNTFRHFTTQTSGISNNDVFVMTETSDGYLWIGTRGGLNRMNPDTYEIKHYRANQKNGISENIVISLYEDKDEVLWVGTLNGLNKYIKSEDRFVIFQADPFDDGSLSNEQIFCMTEDADNDLWIGTNYGLNKYNRQINKFEKYFYTPGNSNSPSNNRIYSIYCDSKNTLWIATLGGGLNKFDTKKKTFEHYRESDGLANDVVYGLLEDDESNLWISTNNGISKFNRKTQSFNNYNVEDGLQSNEFNYGAYYKSKKGELYFGGVNGYNVFNPAKIKLNSIPPKTVITGLTILNQEITPLSNSRLTTDIMFVETFELDYDENVFSIEFASLSYAMPGKNQFAYKIEGINQDWIFNGNRNSVTFANLQPGSYSFKVISSNNDNVWNTDGASLNLIINPPYWKTWWAFLIYIIIGISIIWIIIWYRNRILKREIEVLQQADRLKSEFLAQMSHEIRSPINIILSFSSLLKSEVEQYLDDELKDGFQSINNAGTRIIRTIDMILNMSEIQTGSYDYRAVEINLYDDIFIKLFLEYNQRAKSKNLDFIIECGSEVKKISGDVYTIMQIFANLIDNAIKYTDKGFIKIIIANRNNHVEVEIADSGRGIQKEYLPNIYNTFTQEDQGYTREYEGNGLGLALVKKYCEMNKADIFVESQKGKGTKFKVVFYASAENQHPSKKLFKK